MFLYKGQSMWPYFQDGDLLEVVPALPRTIRVGDCVVLRTGDGRHIAHRVTGTNGTLCTRGDAMPHADLHGKTPPDLIGRIVARHRLGERSPVIGGWPGRLTGIGLRYAGRIDPERPGRGGKLARALRRCCSPLLGRMAAQGTVRMVSLPERGNMAIWHWGGKTVAQRESEGGPWRVRWPWRVVISQTPKG
jgi:hypothetical protein